MGHEEAGGSAASAEVDGGVAHPAMLPRTSAGTAVPGHAGAKRKEELARRKKNERTHTTALWASLEKLAPKVENKSKPRFISKSLSTGRSKDDILQDAIQLVRSRNASTAWWTEEALEVAECGAGLMVVLLETGKICHASRAFLELGSWFDPQPSILKPKPQSLTPKPRTLLAKRQCRFLDGTLVDQPLSVLVHADDKQV